VRDTEITVREVIEEKKESHHFTKDDDFPMVTLMFLENYALLKRKEFVRKVFFKIFRTEEIVNKTVNANGQHGRKPKKEYEPLNTKKVAFIIGKFFSV
jgi:hypothetical protein